MPGDSRQRDLTGYGPKPPRPAWPAGVRLPVSIVINYEEGSEVGVPQGDVGQESMTEWGAYPFPEGIRNLAMESMYEYGSRVGIWRIMRSLESAGIRATVFACARALELAPDVAAAAVRAGHEICSHGWRWEEVFRLNEDEERAHIRMAVESLTRTCGRRPVGWYCRYGPSERTRRLLVEEGGFLYDSDSYADDTPFYVDVDGHQHLILPYAADTNDIQLWLAQPLTTADQFFNYLKDSFDQLYGESGDVARMMSVGLHCRIVGRPGRIQGLQRFIAYAKQFEGVWFATREEIARAWQAAYATAEGPATREGVQRPAAVVLVPAAAPEAAHVGSWSRALVDGERVPGAACQLGRSYVSPAHTSPTIRHVTDEACVVVQGSGHLHTDLGDVPFVPGDAIHIPSGRWHAIVNTGDDDVEMVYTFPGSRRPTTEEAGEMPSTQ